MGINRSITLACLLVCLSKAWAEEVATTQTIDFFDVAVQITGCTKQELKEDSIAKSKCFVEFSGNIPEGLDLVCRHLTSGIPCLERAIQLPCAQKNPQAQVAASLLENHNLNALVQSACKQDPASIQKIIEGQIGCGLPTVTEKYNDVSNCIRNLPEFQAQNEEKLRQKQCNHRVNTVYGCLQEFPKLECIKGEIKKTLGILLNAGKSVGSFICDNMENIEKSRNLIGTCVGDVDRQKKLATCSTQHNAQAVLVRFPWEDKEACQNLRDYVNCVRGVANTCTHPIGEVIKGVTKAVMNATPCHDTDAGQRNTIGFSVLLLTILSTLTMWFFSSHV